MAQQSARRGRENQHFPQCFALGDLDPAHELPYRTVAQYRCITGRTDGSIRLRANTITKFRLDQEGASTDESGTSGYERHAARQLGLLFAGASLPSDTTRSTGMSMPGECHTT
jgi:hypothetical protein